VVKWKNRWFLVDNLNKEDKRLSGKNVGFWWREFEQRE
jgi:hypothetical protein